MSAANGSGRAEGKPKRSKKAAPEPGTAPLCEHPTMPIGLTTGIFDPKHVQALGVAIWAFAWAVRRNLSPDGWVLSGKRLPMTGIAKEIGCTRPQADEWLKRCQDKEYLEIDSNHRLGTKVRVIHPKKWQKLKLDSGIPEPVSGKSNLDSGNPDSVSGKAETLSKELVKREFKGEGGESGPPTLPAPNTPSKSKTPWDTLFADLHDRAASHDGVGAYLNFWEYEWVRVGWTDSILGEFRDLSGDVRDAVVARWAKRTEEIGMGYTAGMARADIKAVVAECRDPRRAKSKTALKTESTLKRYQELTRKLNSLPDGAPEIGPLRSEITALLLVLERTDEMVGHGQA